MRRNACPPQIIWCYPVRDNVAANGCCALLKITPQGQVTPVLRSTSPWSPTGVAVRGEEVLVLEYLHTRSGDRRD